MSSANNHVRIVYHHWKDQSKEYTLEGNIVPYSMNPESERLVLAVKSKFDDVHFEDIIKETIISITQLPES